MTIPRLRSRALYAALAAIVMTGVSSPVAAGPIRDTGILVSGSGSFHGKECSTCVDQITNLSDAQGGAGIMSAATEHILSAANGFSWMASGALENLTPGILPLPVLRARAEAIEPTAADARRRTSATASAQGVQWYQYVGDEPGEFEFTFRVTGVLSGDFETLDGGYNIFSGGSCGGEEIPLEEGGEGGTLNCELGSARVTMSVGDTTTTGGMVDETRTFTFLVDPAQTFYISGFLSANALWVDGENLPGRADASNTLKVTLLSGPTQSLVPLNAVPETGAMTHLVAGLLLIVITTTWINRQGR